MRLDSSISIPEEKIAVVQKLETMRQHEWRALESMGIQELDALQAEVEGANFPLLDIDHPHVKAIREALKVIKKRRSAIRREQVSVHSERIAREQAALFAQGSILLAAEQLQRAVLMCEDPDAQPVPEPLPPIDAVSMTDAELAEAVRECKNALAVSLQVKSSVIALLKTPEAKAVAGEFKRREAALDALHVSALANLEAAKDETARRKAEKEDKAERNAVLQEDLCNVVADLQSRIKELEGKVS